MSKSRILFIYCALFTAMPWMGCTGKTVVRPTVVTPPPAVSPVVGIWQNLAKGGAAPKMIFGADGRLTFQGGLEFFNPGRWDLDPTLQELRITLPEADVDKLQIFQMYVGDGVKAFHPNQKEIVYHFDPETSELNVGGWTYSKVGGDALKGPAPEPELK